MSKLDWERANKREQARSANGEQVAWWWTVTKFPAQCETCRNVTAAGRLIAWSNFLQVSKCETCGQMHNPRMSKKAEAYTKGLVEDSAPPSRVPSPKQVLAARSPKGAWSAHQLAAWGVPWPPPKGWRKDLERCYRTGEAYAPPPPKPGRYPQRGEHAADMAAMKARNAARAA